MPFEAWGLGFIGLEDAGEAVFGVLKLGDPLVGVDLPGVMFLLETSTDDRLLKIIPGSPLTFSEVLSGMSPKNWKIK